MRRQIFVVLIVIGVCFGVDERCYESHDILANGCSVPVLKKFLYKKTFMPACHRHDICYHCAAVFSESRRYCDQLFRGDMLSICSKKFLTRRICRAFAHLYYVGVRVGGKSRYHDEKSSDCDLDWIKSCIV